MTPAPRLLRVRCARWDQVESFLRKKLRADGRLSMKVPFDAELGAPVTLQLELPNQIVIALEGHVAPRTELDRPDATVVALSNARPTIERLEAMLADARAGGEGGDLAATLSVREAELRRLRQQAAHEVLGVSRTPTLEELRRAWRLRARREHPDAVARYGSAALRLTAEEAMIHVTRAYERLRATVVAENRAVLAGTSVRTRGSLALEVAPSDGFEAVALTPPVEERGTTPSKSWSAAAATRPASTPYPAPYIGDDTAATPPSPPPVPVPAAAPVAEKPVTPTPNRGFAPMRSPNPTPTSPPPARTPTPTNPQMRTAPPTSSPPRASADLYIGANPFAEADPLSDAAPPEPAPPPRRVTAPMPAVRPPRPRPTSSQPPAAPPEPPEPPPTTTSAASTLPPLATPSSSFAPIEPPTRPPPVDLPPLLDTDADTLDGFDRPMSRPLSLELDLPLPPRRESRSHAAQPEPPDDTEPSLDAMTLSPSTGAAASPIVAASRAARNTGPGQPRRATGPGGGNTIEQSLRRARSGPGDRFVRAVHDRLALADHAGAAQIATAAHQVYPLDVRLRALIDIAAACAACAQGDRTAAIAALESALAVDPECAEARLALAAVREAHAIVPSLVQDRFR